jgi:methionyl aminopeptidase
MNKNYRNHFIEAGKKAKEVRAYGKSLIKKGASYKEVTTQIRAKIKELGAIPAFPPQIALNEVAAHYLPASNEDIVFSDELIKLDIGVCYKGAIGDCAATIDLSGTNQPLVDAAEAALLAAETVIKVGLPIQEIGEIIEKTILSFGFQPVRNLAGHGLGHYTVHQEPMIPNCKCRMKETIKPGMTFAIEPFATNGIGSVYEKGKAEIFSLTGKQSRGNDSSRAILEKIKTFHGLPFELSDLEEAGAEQILPQLLKNGILEGYPPLVEKRKGLVAQAENSVLVDFDGTVIITTR